MMRALLHTLGSLGIAAMVLLGACAPGADTTGAGGDSATGNAGLASGSHTISARAYDNAGPELVRQTTGTVWGRMNWARSVQTVTWTVVIP